MTRRFLWDDCRDLQRKALLSDAQLGEWRLQLQADKGVEDKDTEAAAAGVQAQVRALFQRELDELIERIRVRQNQQHEATLQQSDLIAVAAGGVLGALNAWMRAPAPTASAAPKPAAPSLWASAFDAAQASLNVARQRRLLDHLHIRHMSGDASSCEHVVLCVNGFMTQGADPTRNWSCWAQDPGVVQYAVLWEAGDATGWNEFCAHANENIKTSSAHALLTHFTGNPWHKAQDKAEQVGILLAQVLVAQPTFCRARKVTLMGHSLGGAVIYSALQELARLRREKLLDDALLRQPLIHSVVFFAGAFVPSVRGIECMVQEILRDGQLVNVFSQRDDVLSKLFWAIQLHGGDPIAAGCAAIDFGAANGTRGVNVDVSDLVPPRMPNQFGHSYGPHMEAIRARVLPKLRME